MDIHNYRKKRLRVYNSIINIFLSMLLSLTIMMLIGVGFMQATFVHFEQRGDVFTDEISLLLEDTAKDFLKQEVDAQAQELIPEDLPEGDLCEQIDFNDIPEEYRQLAIDKCAEGPIVAEDLSGELIDTQVEAFTEELKPEIKTNYDESIANGKIFMNDMFEKYPYLQMKWLGFILSILLVLFFFNNDTPLTINYISKKLMFLVPVVFIIPYLMFKLDFMGFIMNKIDITKLITLPEPINPRIVIDRAVEILSNEMSFFYSTFIPYAVLAFFAGLILWYGNKKLVLPFFVKRYGLLHPHIPDKKTPVVHVPVRDNAGPAIMSEKERKLHEIDHPHPKIPK